MKRLLSTLLVLLMAPAAWAESSADFTVMRDGSPIGRHRVTVIRQGEETLVDVDIALDVSLGFIPLYRYRHQAHEVWRDGRLAALDAATDDNGERFQVTARAAADGLEVTTRDGRMRLPADTIPTSYWNPALVSGRPVLDSQEGRRLELTVTPAGDGRWRLRGDLMLEIAYDGKGRWNGLWFRHKGSDFTYIPRTLAERRP